MRAFKVLEETETLSHSWGFGLHFNSAIGEDLNSFIKPCKLARFSDKEDGRWICERDAHGLVFAKF